MIQKYNTYRILRLFFDSPTKKFQLREISRLVNLGMPSVINHVKKLEKDDFIKKIDGGIYSSFISNRNEKFKIFKRNDILIRIQESGLIELLVDNFVPDTIVLFGSSSRGEDIEESDIDLFLVTKEKKIDLKKFEKQLKRKISFHFEENIKKIPKELLNNIANGIVLYGYLEVV